MSLEDKRRIAEERHKQHATAEYIGNTIHEKISGHARAAMEAGGNGYFECPLVTHVEGNLYQGGCRTGITLPDNFKYVLSLYQWEKYTLPEHCFYKSVEMYDDTSGVPDVDLLYQLADTVNRMRDNNDGDVLVHCQAGLNRSGLVTGLSLVQRGYNPVTAISLMRANRTPMVLCNETFANWLRGQKPPEPSGGASSDSFDTRLT